MEYKMIKKISQNKTWSETDIPCINLTPNWYNALALAVVYVNNDVTMPFNSMTSQQKHKKTLLRAHVNRT